MLPNGGAKLPLNQKIQQELYNVGGTTFPWAMGNVPLKCAKEITETLVKAMSHYRLTHAPQLLAMMSKSCS